MRAATRPSSSSVRARRLAQAAALLGGIALLAAVGATLLGAGPDRREAAAAVAGSQEQQSTNYTDLQLYQQRQASGVGCLRCVNLGELLSRRPVAPQPAIPRLEVPARTNTSADRQAARHEPSFPPRLRRCIVRSIPVPDNALQWTADAQNIVADAFHLQQYPSDCTAVKWLVVRPWRGGLMSNMHYWLRLLLAGYHTGRTVVMWPDPEQKRTFEGCVPADFRCYIPDLTGCELSQHPDREKQLGDTTSHIQTVRRMPVHKFLQQLSRLNDYPTVHIVDPTFPIPHLAFPDRLWELLKAAKAVYMDSEADFDRVHELDRLFMLYSILTQRLFVPHTRILRLAKRLLAQFEGHLEPSKTVAGIHIRQTDKAWEDKYWRIHKAYRQNTEFVNVLLALERQQSVEWNTVLLMSDSETAIADITSHPEEHNLREDVALVYNTLLNRTELEAAGGHLSVGAGQKQWFNDNFLAMLWVFVHSAEHAVVTYSSNIGRFIAEYLAASERVVLRQRSNRCVTSVEDDYDWIV
eukprot:jgi/Chlat1/3172/Chrsp22S03406